MGYRLHVCQKYEVEYATAEGFNNQCEEFHDLLKACGAEYTGESTDAEFEVSKIDWQEVINKLRKLKSLDEDERSEIEDALKWMIDTPTEIANRMEQFLKEADPSHNFLHLTYY